MDALLATIESYYDAVPRRAAGVETLGPFTLFLKQGSGWPFYARPTLGASAFSHEDVTRVRERQRALGVPEAFEWVADVTPGLRAAVEAAGMAVHDHPLMVLDRAAPHRVPTPDGITIRFVTPEDDLARIGAVGPVAFGVPGTAIGAEGPTALAPIASERTDEAIAFERERLRRGWTVMVAAFVEGEPVAIGSHNLVDRVTEVVGVGTLPAYRRRGIGAAITSLLVEDARRRHVETIFLSAGGDDVARIYAQVGFRRIGTACIAEPD